MSANSKELYRLNEQKARERLAELRQHGDAIGDHEVALTRYLIERSVQDGSHGLAEKLISTLAKVSSAADAAAVRRGDLVDRSTLSALATELISHVIAIFCDTNDFHARIDQLCDAIQDSMSKPKEIQCTS